MIRLTSHKNRIRNGDAIRSRYMISLLDNNGAMRVLDCPQNEIDNHLEYFKSHHHTGLMTSMASCVLNWCINKGGRADWVKIINGNAPFTLDELIAFDNYVFSIYKGIGLIPNADLNAVDMGADDFWRRVPPAKIVIKIQ